MKKEGERKEYVVDGKQVSGNMISLVVPNDSRMASCWFFMPPIEKQRMPGMSDLLTNRLITDFG